MSTETLTAGTPNGIDWRRAEFILTLVAFLSFALLPVHLTKIYSGLPAHPLFLHVPVMLIPIAVFGAIACAIRPAWLTRYGIALATLAVVAMGSLFLTMGAGSALREALHLGGGGAFGANSPAALVQRHSHAADILRLLTIAFTAVLILAFAAQRISGGMPTGAGIIDRLLAARPTVLSLRVLLVVLAIACGYSVFKTGDLGAKAVWAGRLNGGGFGGGFGGAGSPGIRPAGPGVAPSGG